MPVSPWTILQLHSQNTAYLHRHVSNGEANTILMSDNIDYGKLNSAKENFTSIYDAADPRAYFRTLGGLDYIIPHVAQRIFLQLIRARAERQSRPVTVLDIGCSYGLNGALLKYALTWDALSDRYAGTALANLGARQIVNLDRSYYASWPRRENVRVIGFDVAGRAVGYAEAVGSIDRGFVVDLESDEPRGEVAEALAEVDIIISTGCVGYVTANTFERIARLSKVGDPAWVASFVLRMFSYDDISLTLRRQGLVTEKLYGATFVQRRFATPDEMTSTIGAVQERGLDPQGFESEGLMHAEFYLSRPADEIRNLPLSRMIAVASGINKSPRAPSQFGSTLQ